ncbi:hypothetical protein BS78_03G333600 [Paspalum vaginatum]|nr:hypothetical protein BS78_03G333600 [Paspalum vaginatum]
MGTGCSPEPEPSPHLNPRVPSLQQAERAEQHAGAAHGIADDVIVDVECRDVEHQSCAKHSNVNMAALRTATALERPPGALQHRAARVSCARDHGLAGVLPATGAGVGPPPPPRGGLRSYPHGRRPLRRASLWDWARVRTGGAPSSHGASSSSRLRRPRARRGGRDRERAGGTRRRGQRTSSSRRTPPAPARTVSGGRESRRRTIALRPSARSGDH